MATRAHEVGAVRVVRAPHTSGGGANEGLRGAFDRALRTVKLDRGDVYEHLGESLPALSDRDEHWRERDARALTEFLRPTDEADPVEGPAYRFSTPDQKYALLTRTLERLAGERPVFVWFDDLQWGSEALGLLEHLVERADDTPAVLTVATLRSDIVREEQWLRERLDDLRAGGPATDLELTPLSRSHQRELLVNLLPLEDDLADRLAERTEGHPLFAMQLLAHWLESDAIVMRPDGFGVAEGRELDLPDDIHQLWRRRLRRLLEAASFAESTVLERALEIAAALGRDVDATEWRAVCRRCNVDRPDELRDQLIERGLAERTDGGWAFGHGLVVDSLEHQARERDRCRDNHRLCAELLEKLYPDSPRQTAARRANHYIAAGDPEAALEPLREEAERLRQSGDLRGQGQTLERRGRLLDTLECPDHDPRRLENEIRQARLQLRYGSSPDALLESIERTRERAERAGNDKLVADACHTLAAAYRTNSDLEAARDAIRRGLPPARASGNPEVLNDVLRESGWTEYLCGNLDEAESRLTEARSVARNAGYRLGEIWTQRNLGWVALGRGEEARASRLFEHCLQESRQGGFRSLEAQSLNGLGEISRYAGDAEEARRHYRRYCEMARELHLPEEVATGHLNLAQVELLAGRFDAVDRHLARNRQVWDKIDRDMKRRLIIPVRLTRAAGTGEWSTFDDLLAAFTDDRETHEALFEDYPWLLEMAGDYAAEAGERERARRVWRLAGELWEELDDEEAAERVAEKMGGAEAG